MPRRLLGIAVLLHAFAHLSVQAWTRIAEPAWLSTALWILAYAGYFAAGLALLRAPVVRDWWKPLLGTATLASMLLVIWIRPAWGLVGAAIDVGALLAASDVLQRRIDADIAVVHELGDDALHHPRWVHAGWVLGAALLFYGTLVTALHPVIMRWG